MTQVAAKTQPGTPAKWYGEWEPTPQMQNLLRAWKENVGITITDLLKNTGLSTSWYYDVFQNDPLAQQWWKEQREKFFGGENLANVHDQLYVGAVKPSSTQHQFQKMYMQRFDPGYVERKELKQTIDVRLQHGLTVEMRLQVLADAFAKARGLPAAMPESEFEGEVVGDAAPEETGEPPA